LAQEEQSDTNSEDSIDIEQVEIEVSTEEKIDLNIEPVEDELLIDDLQLKENFVESEEQLAINITLFSYPFNSFYLNFSYIYPFDYSFDFLFNGLLSGFFYNFSFNLKSTPYEDSSDSLNLNSLTVNLNLVWDNPLITSFNSSVFYKDIIFNNIRDQRIFFNAGFTMDDSKNNLALYLLTGYLNSNPQLIFKGDYSYSFGC